MPQDSALLVIDVQLGFLSGPPPAFRGEQFVGVIAGLQERARGEGVPVVHVRFVDDAGDVVRGGLVGGEIHPSVTPIAGEHVVGKRSTDAFHRTGLHNLLQRLGVARLFVAGCLSELCVDTTCRRALGLGYATTLVADAHTTADVEVADVGARQRIRLTNFTLARVGTGDRTIAVVPSRRIVFD